MGGASSLSFLLANRGPREKEREGGGKWRRRRGFRKVFVPPPPKSREK
ncbi:hypothetical protein LINPERHAP1_LOCUS37755 [Linum perenne]